MEERSQIRSDLDRCGSRSEQQEQKRLLYVTMRDQKKASRVKMNMKQKPVPPMPNKKSAPRDQMPKTPSRRGREGEGWASQSADAAMETESWEEVGSPSVVDRWATLSQGTLMLEDNIQAVLKALAKTAKDSPTPANRALLREMVKK